MSPATTRGAPAAASLSVTGAEQVLRPPVGGLEFLRHDRAGELTTAGSAVAVADGAIRAFDGDAGAAVHVDAGGCSIVPGFVDCHTHLPFAGWRAGEYEQRVAGVPYEEIARQGGGIAASARAFGAATDDEVLDQATALAAQMLAHGTTAFECKSGYGLTIEAELRSLRLAAELGARVAQTTVSTALLAHAIPPGDTADGWLDAVEAALPRVAGETSATALDVFVETMAFDNGHLTRVGAMAAAHGLDLRAHVEQLATHRSIPVALAARARSVDHLACLHPDDIAPLAAADCAAVLLPGAEFLCDERLAPARRLADAGAICVLSTDANPGTSPIVSMPLIIGLAVRRYGWTAKEALLASTLNAAWTIGCSDRIGSLEIGKRADLLLLEGGIEDVAYRLGHNPVVAAVIGGEIAWIRPGSETRVHAA